jgi:isopentenyl-diphosphate delta-isomerase
MRPAASRSDAVDDRTAYGLGMSGVERVVLVDERGERIGTRAKAEVHGRRTPLHLAFSVYVFRPDGAFLFTRRALAKRTWPGVWTNSCCGHPQPDEPIRAAVLRRLRDELGVTRVGDVDLMLPGFRYEAEMADGVRENELCPVFRAVVEDEPRIDPTEIEDFQWVAWPDMEARALTEPATVSPWCALQVSQLVERGEDPLRWCVADDAALPPAARPGSQHDDGGDHVEQGDHHHRGEGRP